MNDILYYIFMVSQVMVPVLLVVLIGCMASIFKKLTAIHFQLEDIDRTVYRLVDEPPVNMQTLTVAFTDAIKELKSKPMKPVGFKISGDSDDRA